MKNKTKIKYSISIILFQMQTLFAQTPGFDDDVQDVPVNNWIVPMAILGLIMVYFFIKKKSKMTVY
jgi:hypothetical protein